MKPLTDIIKVSVDAATFDEQNVFGMGLIARDCTSDLVQAKIVSKQGSVPAEVAEAMAIKEALS